VPPGGRRNRERPESGALVRRGVYRRLARRPPRPVAAGPGGDAGAALAAGGRPGV